MGLGLPSAFGNTLSGPGTYRGGCLDSRELTHPPVGTGAKSSHLMAANCLASSGKLCGESVAGKQAQEMKMVSARQVLFQPEGAGREVS